FLEKSGKAARGGTKVARPGKFSARRWGRKLLYVDDPIKSPLRTFQRPDDSGFRLDGNLPVDERQGDINLVTDLKSLVAHKPQSGFGNVAGLRDVGHPPDGPN